MLARLLMFAIAFSSCGCASYVTPGGPVNLGDINRADVKEAASRKPSTNFPARLAVARVQAPGYQSYSFKGYGNGGFTVLATQELMTDEQTESIAAWPMIAGVAPVNRLLLPATMDSLDDLRASAAKVQADVLLIYTIDTSFKVQGRAYAPMSVLSLGMMPDRDAYITSTASALFTDVRTGFVYGLSEATAKATGLTNAWASSNTVDRKRLEAEQEAFKLLIPQLQKTWVGVAKQYVKQ